MSKINVIGGNLKNKKWEFTSVFGQCTMQYDLETINLKKDLDRVELLNEDKVKKLAGTAGWGIAGAVLLGPLGAIGGMLIGGNKKQIAFAGYLKNGRKFMATTDGKTWEKLMALTF